MTHIKRINELNSTCAWFVDYVKLFQDNVVDIMKNSRISYIDFLKPMEVVHVGSKGSVVFGVRYINMAGVSMFYQFRLEIENTPHLVGIEAGKIDLNKYVLTLVNDNKNKLPELHFNSMGAVIN